MMGIRCCKPGKVRDFSVEEKNGFFILSWHKSRHKKLDYIVKVLRNGKIEHTTAPTSRSELKLKPILFLPSHIYDFRIYAQRRIVWGKKLRGGSTMISEKEYDGTLHLMYKVFGMENALKVVYVLEDDVEYGEVGQFGEEGGYLPLCEMRYVSISPGKALPTEVKVLEGQAKILPSTAQNIRYTDLRRRSQSICYFSVRNGDGSLLQHEIKVGGLVEAVFIPWNMDPYYSNPSNPKMWRPLPTVPLKIGSSVEIQDDEEEAYENIDDDVLTLDNIQVDEGEIDAVSTGDDESISHEEAGEVNMAYSPDVKRDTASGSYVRPERNSGDHLDENPSGSGRKEVFMHTGQVHIGTAQAVYLAPYGQTKVTGSSVTTKSSKYGGSAGEDQFEASTIAGSGFDAQLQDCKINVRSGAHSGSSSTE